MASPDEGERAAAAQWREQPLRDVLGRNRTELPAPQRLCITQLIAARCLLLVWLWAYCRSGCHPAAFDALPSVRAVLIDSH